MFDLGLCDQSTFIPVLSFQHGFEQIANGLIITFPNNHLVTLHKIKICGEHD